MDRSLVPRSELLHARLREAKSQSKRHSSSILAPDAPNEDAIPSFGEEDDLWALESQDHWPAGARTHNNSPVVSSKADTIPNPSSRRTSRLASQPPAPRNLGLRDMEDRLDKLSKQNFDLKLEVFHRREKTEELERKVQQLEEMLEIVPVLEMEKQIMEADNNELLTMNEELIVELEMRDKALNEAVGIICELEARVKTLQMGDHADLTIKEKHPVLAVDLAQRQLPREWSEDGRLPQYRSQIPHNILRHTPSFLLDEASHPTALQKLYPVETSDLRPQPSYASSLPRQDRDYDDASLAPQSLHDLSDLDVSSSLPVNQSSPMKDTNLGSTHDSQTRAARMRQARTSRWVVSRALSPSKATSTGPDFDSNSGEFGSLDSVLQRLTLQSASQPPQHQVGKALATGFAGDEAWGHSGLVQDRGVIPRTPETVPVRPLRHASPSIRRGERGLPETPLSRRQRDSSATLSDDCPISAGGYLTSLNGILPCDVAFYYDGPSFEIHPNSHDASVTDASNVRNTDANRLTPKKRTLRGDDVNSPVTDDTSPSSDTVYWTPPLKHSLNAARSFNSQELSNPVRPNNGGLRPTHQLTSSRSEPVTTTLARHEIDPAAKPVLRRWPFSGGTQMAQKEEQVYELEVRPVPSTKANIHHQTPPRRSSLLCQPTANLHHHRKHSRSPNSSGIPYFPSSNITPSTNHTPKKTASLPATSTNLGMAPPLPPAVGQAYPLRTVHSSTSERSEPAPSTVSGTSWTKVFTPSERSGSVKTGFEANEDGKDSPTVVAQKKQKESRSRSLVRRFSLRRGTGKFKAEGEGDAVKMAWV